MNKMKQLYFIKVLKDGQRLSVECDDFAQMKSKMMNAFSEIDMDLYREKAKEYYFKGLEMPIDVYTKLHTTLKVKVELTDLMNEDEVGIFFDGIRAFKNFLFNI